MALLISWNVVPSYSTHISLPAWMSPATSAAEPFLVIDLAGSPLMLIVTAAVLVLTAIKLYVAPAAYAVMAGVALAAMVFVPVTLPSSALML